MIEFYKRIFRAWDRLWMLFAKKSFKAIGKNCYFHPTDSDFHYSHISLGDNVSIGNQARFWCSSSAIIIGSHVVIGPQVSIIAGNHSFHIPGKWIDGYKIYDKKQEDDLPVHIDDDVWIGTNVTILNGVHIGRGVIIAAGAVVTKDIPPYRIGGGIPCKAISNRFSIEEIIEHEKALYPKSKRYTKEQLESFRR